MVGYLASLGVLSEHVTMAHGIWLTDADLDVLVDTGVSLSHNPISNLKLGSGIAPWRKYGQGRECVWRVRRILLRLESTEG